MRIHTKDNSVGLSTEIIPSTGKAILYMTTSNKKHRLAIFNTEGSKEVFDEFLVGLGDGTVKDALIKMLDKSKVMETIRIK